MNYKLLDYYFENELYLQYLPMKTDKFIKFCKDLGIKINRDYLEELEKDKKFFPIFRVNVDYSIDSDAEKIVKQLSEDYETEYYNSTLSSTELFLKTQNEKQQIYFPKDYNFIPYSEFKDSKSNQYKAYNYYSAYQIYHLEKIINEELPLINITKMIDLLISIQIYSPFGRSNMKEIVVKDDYEVWKNYFNNFNINDIFQILDITDDFLITCYRNICGNLKRLLGSNDAIQLWKNVKWKEKDKCIGQTRLGIEYLHWAMMLKRCIEDYYKREIYDVDEVQYISAEKIKLDIPQEEKGFTLRGRRNKLFINEINGKYEFNLNRKKLFYLANKLTLDYHPRILIFVEGTTEEVLIPKFFDEFYGNFEDTGFEIVNIKGISRFFSGDLSQNSQEKVIVSNFKNLISFNLNKWQTIPFFIGDNEGKIVEKLKSGKIFDLKDTFYLIYGFSINEYKQIFKYTFNDFWNTLLTCHDLNFDQNKKFASDLYDKTKSKNSMIDEWIHTWKQDFELDNFTPEELVEAINSECNLNISVDDVNKLKSYNESHKNNKKSINKLVDDDAIKNNKVQINKKAFDILVENYHEKGEDYIKQRPIFKVINKLFDLRYVNDTSKNTVHSINKLRKIYDNIFNE